MVGVSSFEILQLAGLKLLTVSWMPKLHEIQMNSPCVSAMFDQSFSRRLGK